MSEAIDHAAGMQATIREYVLREFLPGEEAASLTNSTPLITGGVLDSIATVRLVSFLEESYRVRFETADVSVDNLDTIDRITHTLLEKLGA